jgi:hypothetical protein
VRTRGTEQAAPQVTGGSPDDVFLPLADLGYPVDTDAPSYFPDDACLTTILVDPTEEVVATQRDVDGTHPAVERFDAALMGGADQVTLVSIEGTLYISDGHHRLAGARRAGVAVSAVLAYARDEDEGEDD